jgi:hypothetical protein
MTLGPKRLLKWRGALSRPPIEMLGGFAARTTEVDLDR